jgi:hypothetical protein
MQGYRTGAIGDYNIVRFSRGLVALKDNRERLEELEQDVEAVLEYRTRMAPEALSVLIPEERHQF